MADPSWLLKQGETRRTDGGSSAAGFDDGGAAARGQAAELLRAPPAPKGREPGGQRGQGPCWGDRDSVTELVAPSHLSKDSQRAFQQIRTVVEGTRLTQAALLWAAVILAATSSPAEYFVTTGVGVANDQVPFGSEAEAVAAMPAVMRARIDLIVVGMLTHPNLSEEDRRYWESVQQRLGVK